MRKLAVFFVIFIFGGLNLAHAQEVVFGKNKVQYRQFDWDYIQSDHFDVHFYDGQYELAKFAHNRVERMTEKRISVPPMVGVPAFWKWLSGPSSRMY